MTEAIQYSSEKPREITQLPEPSGFRLLIALPEVEETTKGGLYIPDERRDAESVASIVGFVLGLGFGLGLGLWLGLRVGLGLWAQA